MNSEANRATPRNRPIAWPIRWLLLAGRGVDVLGRAFRAVRDEIMLAYVAPEARDPVTAAIFSRAGTYLPSGTVFEHGLFAWESEILSRPDVPQRGRVLLGGAGGGREFKALAERGYTVLAFEPAGRLCEGCRRIAVDFAGAQVAEASYADLVRLARGAPGPLSGFRAPFDLVWLGWGSFAHVTMPEEQLAVLASIRSLAPAAPVVVSVGLRASVPQPVAGNSRVRSMLRAIFSRLGGRDPGESVEFTGEAGFAYSFTEAELRSLFRAAGYSVSVFESESYPHALLVPDEISARA